VLRSQNLLLLGCGYPDWEARFFLRGLREKPFRGRSSTLELMVEATADPSLVVFLGRNSIQVYDGGGPVEFLDELFRRWKQREKTAAAPEIQAAALPAARASGRVFLSYASEDRRIVDKLADALGRADIPIWKDDRQLTGGDLWNEVIREAVSRCELFVPCISHSTTSQAESYFYGEWNLALDRSRNLAPDEKFIFPVTLDDTPIDDPRVALFKHLQWTRLDDQGWDAQVQELARALDLAMRARREQAAGYR
jgi:hypothetical protein